MSLADIVVFDLIDKASDGGTFSVEAEDCLDNFEHLKALIHIIKTSPKIKDYLESRPSI